MAKTFFSFDTSLNNGDLLSDNNTNIEDDESKNEEEYDARNDETFGGDLPSSDEDWEQQHEQFAEIEESSKAIEEMKQVIDKLVIKDNWPYFVWELDDSGGGGGDESIWSTRGANGDAFDQPLQSRLRQKVDGSPLDCVDGAEKKTSAPRGPQLLSPQSFQPKKICTVEELERNLLKSKQQQSKPPFPSVPHQPYHALFPPHLPNRPPPGLHPPHMYLPPYMGQHNVPPPGLRMMPPPHFMSGGRPFPPGLMHPGSHQFPVNHPFNFPPPPRNLMMPNCNQMPRNYGAQQRTRHDSNGYRPRNGTPTNAVEHNRDEYAGLMTNREKQWLLNIQLLQLNTGTPYFDDYYYTMYKERKASNSSNQSRKGAVNKSERYYFNNLNQHRNGHHKNNERQDNQNIMQPRVYTPLQFENSLGKLQCGSVTAPRKIIDMDIVTPDKDSEGASAPRDTRKSKQILLELEAMYTLFLKAMDLKHPLAQSDMEKLREMKQKQRLKELEAAQTAEQKQEVLKLLRQESKPPAENQHDYFVKILKGLLVDEKFASFFNFSKGKMLVMRLLPYLTPDAFSCQLRELWFKVLLSLPTVGKRDTMGDNILPRFYLHFKGHVETYTMTDLIELSSILTEAIKQDSVRSTPIAIRGRPRLHFILSNKFGISAVATLLAKSEQLIRSTGASEDQLGKWSDFLNSAAEILISLKDIPVPEERIPKNIVSEHLKRFDNLTADGKTILENVFGGDDVIAF